jgi:tetratricopeptide (TPR) repeat protein
MQLRSKMAIGFGLFMLTLLGATPAPAQPITEFFSDEMEFGLDPDGLVPFAVAGPDEQIPAANPEATPLAVGGGLTDPDDLLIQFSQGFFQIIARPDEPSEATPYVFDMLLTITNTSGEVLDDAVLAFTRVVPTWPTPENPFRNSGLGIDVGDREAISGIDISDVLVLLYEFPSTPSESANGEDQGETEVLYLPALSLGRLEADADSITAVVRFTVEDALPDNGLGGFELPEVGATGFRTIMRVPEPSPALLLGVALLALLGLRARSSLGALALVAAVLATSTPASADDEAAVRALRARSLATEGRCEAAQARLERSDTEATGEAWLDVGRCYVGAKDFDTALLALQRALSLDPSLAGVYLHRGIAEYQLGRPAAARESLERARAAGVIAATLYLYEGLLDLDEGRNDEAAHAFASATDDENVGQLASYYEGMALERARDFSGARSAYTRAARAPDGPWSPHAQRGLDRLGTRTPGRSWLQAMVGGEYDTNVALRGSGVELLSGQQDARLVWSAEAGAEFVRGPDWRAGGLIYYYGSRHDDLRDFDPAAPSAALWLERDLSERTLGLLRYDFSYVLADAESFLSSNTVTSAVHHDWGPKGRTRLGVSGFAHNYRYPVPQEPDVPGLDEKSVRRRDGNGIAVGFDHRLPIPLGRNTELRGGYGFERYFARGKEYGHQAHEFHVGAETMLPFELRLDLLASYTYRPYRDSSSFPDPATGLLESSSRRDSVHELRAELERRLTDEVSVTLRYRTQDHDSNTDVWNYRRSIVGLYFTVRTEK